MSKERTDVRYAQALVYELVPRFTDAAAPLRRRAQATSESEWAVSALETRSWVLLSRVEESVGALQGVEWRDGVDGDAIP